MRIPHIWQPGDTIGQVEQDIILSCLRQKDGNLTEVSKELRIARSTLYKRLKKVGLSTQHDIMNWLRTYAPGG